MIDQADNLRKLVEEADSASIHKINVKSKVIAVSSGKGGVGKSNLVANLAICFARIGKKVVIVDADLGLANIEVLFGIIPTKNLSHVLYEDLPLSMALTEGPLGIKFLSGGSGLRELSKINNREQERVINNLDYLDREYDIILIDTGAGISDIVLNFVKAANDIIVITTPEPTSITDAYALIKIIKEDSEPDTKINLVVNKVESDEEGIEVYNKLLTVADKFLKMKVVNLGFLPTDVNLVTAVKRQNPTSILFPDTSYSKAVNLIAYKILDVNVEEKSVEQVKASFATKLLKFFGKKNI